MTDLLNAFAEAAEKERHLQCYRGLIRRARPYTLDDDATALVTELASGPTINDKLAIYRVLARLPFDVVWLEFPYAARFYARQALGVVGHGQVFEDAPDRMGWIMERITPTMFRATTVVRYATTNSGRQVDTFCATHVISTEGPVEFRSFVRDPTIREAIIELNKNQLYSGSMWGFGTEKDGKKVYSIPPHLQYANAIDVPPSWEPIIEKTSGGDLGEKRKEVVRHVGEACGELRGDLRFLMAALATINEVPMTYANFQQPGSRRIGGSMKQFMVNRIVTIAIPKKRGRTNKVMKLLRLAEVRMRRHEVSGYWKRVRFGDGRVERRWINEYMRGDAALGFVHQVREVVEST